MTDVRKDLRRPVVVAVGGSVSGRAAIQLAAAEAGYRQAPLIVVTAFQAAAESMLGDEMAAALGDRAEQTELRAVQGPPGRKLVETAREANAQMIVLASGLSGLAEAVSQYVLRNAPCPVLVVPDL